MEKHVSSSQHGFQTSSYQMDMEEKATQLQTADWFKITHSTLSQWIQQHKKLNESSLRNSGNVKLLLPAELPELKQALFAWTEDAHAHQIAVNNVILREKAGQLGLLLNVNMNYSDGWLNNFKK